MLKKFLIISFIFLFSFVNSAYAHTHMESSSPQIGEVMTEQLKEITLTFEGKIEQSSSFTLQDVAGEAIPVDHLSVSENVLTGILSTPLENGKYFINWNIIGADGHVIEGEIPFTVDVAAPDDNAVDAEVTDAELIMDTAESEAVASENLADDEPTEDTSSYLVPTLIGLLILIIVGSFIFIAKRKQ